MMMQLAFSALVGFLLQLALVPVLAGANHHRIDSVFCVLAPFPSLDILGCTVVPVWWRFSMSLSLLMCHPTLVYW